MSEPAVFTARAHFDCETSYDMLAVIAAHLLQPCTQHSESCFLKLYKLKLWVSRMPKHLFLKGAVSLTSIVDGQVF